MSSVLSGRERGSGLQAFGPAQVFLWPHPFSWRSGTSGHKVRPMLNVRWSLLLGASLSSLVSFGCSSDPESTASGTGGKASTGGATGAMGGSKATGGATATGGGSATGGATATGSALEATVDSIKAYIMAGTYKNPPWKSETAAPREKQPGSPHEKVQVWFNDTLQASAKAGNGKAVGLVVDPPHTTGSMVVKETYDANGAMVAVAANLKVAGAATAWAYYGVGDGVFFNEKDKTYTEAAPFFKTAPRDGLFACTFCHFGSVFTPVP